jgi:ribosomal protein L35AE/L33A
VDLGDAAGIVQAKTWDELKAGAMKATKAAATKVAVRIVLVSTSDGVKVGTATGVHGRSGNVMVRWDSGKSEQLSYYGSGSLYVVPDEETAKRIVEAAGKVAAAQKDFQAVAGKYYERGLRQVVEKAIAAAAGEVAE